MESPINRKPGANLQSVQTILRLSGSEVEVLVGCFPDYAFAGLVGRLDAASPVHHPDMKSKLLADGPDAAVNLIDLRQARIKFEHERARARQMRERAHE